VCYNQRIAHGYQPTVRDWGIGETHWIERSIESNIKPPIKRAQYQIQPIFNLLSSCTTSSLSLTFDHFESQTRARPPMQSWRPQSIWSIPNPRLRESNTNQNRNHASREGKSPMAIPMCKSYSATDQSELQCVTQTRSSPSPPYLERVLIYNPTHGVFIQIYPSLPATKPLFPESYQRSHNQAGFSHMKIESGPISSGPRIN